MLHSGNRDSYLGAIHDQQFYAVHCQAGDDLSLPFSKEHFNALIHMEASVNKITLKNVALQLLQHGMRAAVCHGEKADELGNMIDTLVDEGGFVHEGRTVFSSVHDDEDLHDVIDYFVLPNGLASVGLIITIGGEQWIDEAIECFEHITSGSACHELALA